MKPAAKVFPARSEPTPPAIPEAKPPIAPAFTPAFKASLILPPAAKVFIPEPIAAPKIGPNGVIANAMGKIIGTAFLITLTTFLTSFLTPLKSFLRKNSG